jgi:hypothetical protein
VSSVPPELVLTRNSEAGSLATHIGSTARIMFRCPLGFVANSSPPMMAFECCHHFRVVLVPRHCSLHDHCIVCSTLTYSFFLDVLSIKQGHLAVVHVPMILQLLRGAMTGWIRGRVEGLRYLALKTQIGLVVAGDRVIRVMGMDHMKVERMEVERTKVVGTDLQPRSLCLEVEHMEVVGTSTDRTNNDMAMEVPPEPEVQQGE